MGKPCPHARFVIPALAMRDGEVTCGLVALRSRAADQPFDGVQDGARTMDVPGSGRQVAYDAGKRVAVGLSRLGTSRAVAVGAYALALEALVPGVTDVQDLVPPEMLDGVSRRSCG